MTIKIVLRRGSERSKISRKRCQENEQIKMNRKPKSLHSNHFIDEFEFAGEFSVLEIDEIKSFFKVNKSKFQSIWKNFPLDDSNIAFFAKHRSIKICHCAQAMACRLSFELFSAGMNSLGKCQHLKASFLCK